jgi:hypothetical protein
MMGYLMLESDLYRSFPLLPSLHGALAATEAMGGFWLWRISGWLAACTLGMLGCSPSDAKGLVAGSWVCPGWIMFALLVMGFPGATECCNYIVVYLKAGLN